MKHYSDSFPKKHYYSKKLKDVNSDKNMIPSKVPNDRCDSGRCLDKAKKLGYYNLIACTIMEVREDQTATFDDVYKVLYERYPMVFTCPPEKLANTRQIVEQDTRWMMAYYNKDGQLEKLLKLRMEEIATKDNLTDEQIQYNYDLVMKYKMLQQKIDREKERIEVERLKAEAEVRRLDSAINKAVDEMLNDNKVEFVYEDNEQ